MGCGRALEDERVGENAGGLIRSADEKFGGAEFSSGRGQILFRQQPGFPANYAGNHRSSLVRCTDAQEGEAMQQGYWYTVESALWETRRSESVGITARSGRSAPGARKIKTTRAPDSFRSGYGASLIRSIVGGLGALAL